jgi:hypothetical protein
METAIQVIWWIGLVGALIATVVILKQVVLILRVLRGIHRLAVLTRTASQGIARNVATAPRLGATTESARGLRDAVHALAVAADSIQRKLARETLRGG